MDHEEGFGSAVEVAGCQRVWFSRDDVAQVVIGVGWFAEGEFGNSVISVISVVKQVTQWFKDVTLKRRKVGFMMTSFFLLLNKGEDKRGRNFPV